MTVLGETVEIDVFEKKRKKSMRMELHNCYNIKTEDVPIEVKSAPYDEHDELEDFFQILEEESRLFEKEREGREVVEEGSVDVENVNLEKEIDILKSEKRSQTYSTQYLLWYSHLISSHLNI